MGVMQEGLIMKYNVDSNGNPISIKIINEIKQVIPNHNLIQLNQIPDEYFKVKVTSPSGMSEVYDVDNIGNNNFKVDYNSGKVFFHPSMVGKSITFEYYGKGVELISTERVFTQTDTSGNVVETLQEFIEKGEEAMEYYLVTGDAYTFLNTIKTTTELGKTTEQNLRTTNTLATNTMNEIKNTYMNKKIEITQSQWVSVNGAYEKVVIHNCKNLNPLVAFYKKSNNVQQIISCVAINENSSKVIIDEAIDGTLIVSSGSFNYS